MKLLQSISLVTATVTTGLMAGLFAAFARAIMPALNRAGDRTFVETMQRINVAIINGWFMLCFLGAVLATAVAAAAHIRSDRDILPWILAALVLYIVVLAVTGGANVPLNNQLDDAGNPDHIQNLAAVRENFESKWVAWNLVRTIANVAAFALLTWALILHGRADSSSERDATGHPPVSVSMHN